MSKAIQVDDALYEQLEQRAAAEGTTVEALAAQAVQRDAERDPRLDVAADAFRDFVNQHGPEFDAAFGDADDHVTAPGRAA